MAPTSARKTTMGRRRSTTRSRKSTPRWRSSSAQKVCDDRCMFRRIANLIRGFFSLFIGGIERQNPEALLEVEKENLRKQIANYNQGLAAHAGLCERLMTQVRKIGRASCRERV